MCKQLMKWLLASLAMLLLTGEKMQAQTVETELSRNLTTWDRHEIHASVGDPGLYYLISESLFYLDCDPVYRGDDWFGADTYTGDTYTTGTWSVGYLYHPLRWLWLGADVASLVAVQNIYDRPTGERIGRNCSSYTQLQYTMRFSYLNRRHVYLYSGFSTGILFCGYNQSLSEILPAVQFTPIGVMAGGEHLKAFAEIGYGMRSLFTVGISYSIGNK